MKIKFFNFELELSDEEMMTLWRSCKERNKDLTFEQFLSNVPKLFLSNNINRKRTPNMLLYGSLAILMVIYISVCYISEYSLPFGNAWLVFYIILFASIISTFGLFVGIILKIGNYFIDK